MNLAFEAKGILDAHAVYKHVHAVLDSFGGFVAYFLFRKPRWISVRLFVFQCVLVSWFMYVPWGAKFSMMNNGFRETRRESRWAGKVDGFPAVSGVY